MKIVISAIAIVILMIGAQSAYAETAYQSGYRHGVADGKFGSIIYCLTPTSPCPEPTIYIH